MRMLVVEDDPVLSHGIVQVFKNSFAVDHCSRGNEALDAIATVEYDIVLLDLGLPGIDGANVLKTLRNKGNMVPVLILTARDTTEDRVRGLDLGADDYVVKPFEVPELEARVRALLRRKYLSSQSEITVGGLRFDTIGKTVFVGESPIELSKREVTLLEILILNAGRVVSKDILLDKMYGWDEEITPNAIEVYMHRIRKKIAPYGFSIKTLRGLGYLMDKLPPT